MNIILLRPAFRLISSLRKKHDSLFISRGPEVLETPEGRVRGWTQRELDEAKMGTQPAEQALTPTHVLRELAGSWLPGLSQPARCVGEMIQAQRDDCLQGLSNPKTYIHAHTDTQIQTLTHICTCMCTQVCTCTHTCTHVCANHHTHVYTHSHMRTRTLMHTHAHAYICRASHTCMHAYTHTYMRTEIHAHTHTHKTSHTYVHMHVLTLPSLGDLGI